MKEYKGKLIQRITFSFPQDEVCLPEQSKSVSPVQTLATLFIKQLFTEYLLSQESVLCAVEEKMMNYP